MIQITAEAYFVEIDALFGDGFLIEKERIKQGKYLFERFCKQVTVAVTIQFSNNFSRLTYIQQHFLGDNPSLAKSLHRLRHWFHAASRDEDARYTMDQSRLYPFVEVVALLLDGSVPCHWLAFAPKQNLEEAVVAESKQYDRLRARVYLDASHQPRVLPDHGDFMQAIPFAMRGEPRGTGYFSSTLESLYEGAQVNLLDATYLMEENRLVVDMIILEPDFLLDISTLAECFKDYGAHPLNYFMAKLSPDKNTPPMLLGNIANQFLDDIVNETKDQPADYLDSMQKAFRLSPIALATCAELEDVGTQKKFFEATKEQFWHIQQVVQDQFAANGFDRTKILLEPAFVCESLGVQGRLDLLHSDYTRFIELKSGKAKELYPSKDITHKENHYVQMLLYYAVLHFNLGVDPKEVEAYLLYSKYPVLYQMPYYGGLLKQALDLRNQIVALEYKLQERNDPAYSRSIIQTINSETLNTRGLSSAFYQRYLRPSIDAFQESIVGMGDLESDYFFSLFNFIIREQYTAKAGDVDAEFKKGVTSLWDASLDEKLDAGEIVCPLSLDESRIADGKHMVRFEMPQMDLLSLPNFRQGDAVMLYQRENEAALVTNHQVFKATIEQIDATCLVLALRVIQKNQTVLPKDGIYAIERDYMDSSFAAMLKGLALFLHATPARKSLLLGQRVPRVSRQEVSVAADEDDFARVVRKAQEAEDFFLLVGPPGTGKTSCALKQMVDVFYGDVRKNILLLAYTNKAVDEICGSIASGDAPVPFIRIGQESTCDVAYRDHLLQHKIKHCTRRTQVREVIEQGRVFVGTVSSLSRQAELFKIKRFDVAIIDEASQILEPQLLGLLSATDSVGRDAIAKFIMIGDHKQLPAVVVQPSEVSEVMLKSLQQVGFRNLNESLFQRLYRLEVNAHRDTFIDMLSKQGRMHPAISEFVSTHFYHGELDVVPLAHQQEIDAEQVDLDLSDLKQVVRHKRFAFIPVVKKDLTTPNKVNRAEAQCVARLIALWYTQQLKTRSAVNLAREVGVITPYRSQIAMIRKELQSMGLPCAEQIVIDTVERFQGGQRDLMIYSCCMNAAFQLNFLSNTIEERGRVIDRKLNVALTRARKQLFVVGNPRILERDPIYRSLLTYLKEQDSWYLRSE